MSAEGSRRRSGSSSKRNQYRTSGGLRPGVWLGPAIGALVSVAAIGFVIWQFGSDNRTAPGADPMWRSDGTANLLSGRAVAQDADPKTIDEARQAARAALDMSPLSSTALGVLADAAQASGDAAEATRLREFAYERTRRDMATLRWKYNAAIGQRDFAAAIAAADALLRQNPDVGPDARYVLGTMVALAADPQAGPHVVAALQRPSAWRRRFLDTLASIGQPEAFVAVIGAMPPPIATDPSYGWSTYLNRLITAGDSRGAYATWTGLLPPEQLEQLGYLFNGSFESVPTNPPFDWSVLPARGTELIFGTDDARDGDRSVQISYSGAPVRVTSLSQTLILDPGNYALSGDVKTDNLQTNRGFVWRIYCQDGRNLKLIGESPLFSGTSDWSRFSTAFEVPSQACDHQLITFEIAARIDSERIARGRIFLDGLSIEASPGAGDGDRAGGTG